METGKTVRSNRGDSLIHRLISQFILEESNKSTIITVIRVERSGSERVVKVYCSSFPPEKAEEVEKFLKRKEKDCKSYLKKHSSLRIIPDIRFLVRNEKRI